MNNTAISTLKSITKRGVRCLQSIQLLAPWGPYKRISDSDRNSFNKVLSIWRPKDDKKVFILRWMITEWCNYKCSYCDQTHDRSARKGKYTAHAFDNSPLGKWCDSFHRHFHDRRLSLLITGGEPMLDRKNMGPLLKELTSMPTVECIRIDTNISWKPDNYKGVDPKKIILMCTYHPAQVSKESFFASIKRLLDFGYKIGMVNFVMNSENFNIFKKIKQEMFELGIPLHPNPLWDSKGQYSEEDLSILKEELPLADYQYRTQTVSPFGKKCLFPSLAYQMDQTGQIQVGCHPQISGSFFENSLPPTFVGPAPCPMKSCACLDMYSFLKNVDRNTDVNPLLVYSEMLKNKSLRHDT
ncbi:MAG: radical SAM protein [Anaerohalosphaera sp.]|nr:radical SAM protein [Anaerohalosphaera sp.]